MKQQSDKQMNPKVAVVGAGYWGKNLIRNFYDIGVLASICDSNTQLLQEWKSKYPNCHTTNNFEELLGKKELEAVAIATPAETHASFVRQALHAGKDVLVEKPLCLSTEEGQALVSLAQEKKSHFDGRTSSLVSSGYIETQRVDRCRRAWTDSIYLFK